MPVCADRARLRVARVAVLAVAVLLPHLAYGAETAFGIDELAALLQRESPATARFRETQHRRVLKEPLVREGELHFEPPDRFERRVLVPAPETYRIEGETLTVLLPGRAARELSLRNQPLLGGVLQGFKAIVSGRLGGLAPAFTAVVSGTREDWQLELTPADADIGRWLEVIRVTGREAQALRFEIRERRGDFTVMDLEPGP